MALWGTRVGFELGADQRRGAQLARPNSRSRRTTCTNSPASSCGCSARKVDNLRCAGQRSSISTRAATSSRTWAPASRTEGGWMQRLRSRRWHGSRPSREADRSTRTQHSHKLTPTTYDEKLRGLSVVRERPVMLRLTGAPKNRGARAIAAPAATQASSWLPVSVAHWAR
jgi:hypothetical protein